VGPPSYSHRTVRPFGIDRNHSSVSGSTSTVPRVGIVGLGNIGRYHADRLARAGGQVACGVDVSEPARSSFAEQYGVPTFETVEGLFETGVDAVVVTTPNGYHEEYAVAALDHDVPVLVEKPLAHTVESAERILAADEASEAFCMVGFHKRYLDGARALFDRIARGDLGDVHDVEANYVRRRGIPGRGGWFTQQAVSGGGALLDIGVHVLDLACHFLSFPAFTSVTATILSEFGSRHDYTYLDMYGEDQGPDRFDVEDSVRAFLRDDRGTSVSLNVAWAANELDDTALTVTGSDGGARLDHESGDLELYTVADGGNPQLLTTRVQTRQTDPVLTEQRAFIEGVRTGVAPAWNTAHEGYQVQRLVDAIYTAGETGDPVHPGDIGTRAPERATSES